MRVSGRAGRNTWISMPLSLWLAGWLILAPFIAAWLALKLLVLLIEGAGWLYRRAHAAPAVPPAWRTPPRRGHGRRGA